MKGKRLLVILLALVLAFTSFTACGLFGKDKDKDKDKDKNTEQTSEKDTEKDDGKDKVESVKLTDKALGGDLLIDFTKGANEAVIFESDGWSNGDVFNVVWTKGNVKYGNGKMALGITKEDKKVWLNDKEVTLPYTAGEARSQNYFGYGDYTVKMKPSANAGTASTFFLCTGNYDSKYVLDANGNVVFNADGSIKSEPNPHDEIDIEFLGKDTTKVQFNFFVNGVGGNEYMYDLGFDASKEYHEYGFRWEKDSITWFVDGEPVYKVTTDKTAKAASNLRIVETIPSTPGRILMNYWCGNEGAEGWMGKYEGNVKDNGTEYHWIKTTTKGAPLNPEVKLPGGEAEVPEVDWSKIAAIKPTFESTEKYTVTTNGTAANVKYDGVGGSSYINVEMDITEAAKQKNVLHLTLKNNGKKDVQVRVNIVDAELLAKGAKNSSTNKAATMNGKEAKTDLEWGGSFFDIKAGETVEAVISYTGNVEKLQLMIDSARNDAENRSGDVTVSNIKFTKVGDIVDENTVGKYKINPIEKIMKATANVNVRDLPSTDGNKIGSLKKGEVVAVTGQCAQTKWYRINYKDGKVGYVSYGYLEDAPGEQPAPSASNSIYINGKEYFFDGDGYTLKSNEKNELNVSYSKIEGAKYKNIATGLTGLAADLNKLTLKVTNNGTKAVKVRIDVQSPVQITENTKASNIYATQDGVEVFTDKDWGGSQFEIAAGKTSTLEVYFDASKKTDALIIFIDSWNYLDEGKGVMYSGNITFKEVKFGKGEAPVKPEEPKPEQPKPEQPKPEDPKPETPVVPETEIQSLTFWADEADGRYTVDNQGTTVGVKFNGTNGDYKPCGSNGETVAALLQANDTFSVKLKNNGTTDVKVRFDIKGAKKVGNTDACNVSATSTGVDGAWTDTDWGGSFVTVKAGETITFTIKYQPNGTHGLATEILFYVEPGKADAVKADFTLSEFKFANSTGTTPEQPKPEEPKPEQPKPEEPKPEEPKPEEPKPEEPKPENPGTGDGTGSGSGDSEKPETGLQQPQTEDQTMSFWTPENDTRYQVANNGKTVTVKFNGKNEGHTPCGTNSGMVSNLETLLQANDIFSVTMKNNGTEKVKVRWDIKGATWVGTNPNKADQGTDACNVEAVSTGKNGAWTDKDWGGSFVEVEAGETVVLIIKYEPNGTHGLAKELLFYVAPGSADVVTADLTFSEFRFANTNPSTDDGNDDDEEGTTPTPNPGTGNEGGNQDETTTPEKVYTTINDKEIEVDGNTDVYAVTEDEDEVNIKYEDLAGSSWSNLCLWVKEVAAENNTFHVEITNNGEETVKIRVDLKEEDGALTNLSAIMTAVEVSSVAHDSTYIEIEAGSTAIIEIKYDTEMETAMLYFFIDSWLQDENTYSGDITLAGMDFKTVTPSAEDDEEEEEPEDLTGKLKVNWVNSGFVVTDTTALQTEVKVNYTKQAAEEEWGICSSFAPAEDITGKNTFTVKVKNNGTTEAKFRVDLKNVVGEGESKVETSLYKAADATNEGYLAPNEAFVVIGAGKEVVLKITFDASQYDLTDIIILPALSVVEDEVIDLTFSNFAFTTEGDAAYIQLNSSSAYYTLANQSASTWQQEDNIKYVFDGEVGQSYNTCTLWVQDKVTSGQNTCSFKLVNNKDTEVKLRIDFQYESKTIEGTVFTLGAGEEIFYTLPMEVTNETGAVQQVVFYVGPGETSVDADITINSVKVYTK